MKTPTMATTEKVMRRLSNNVIMVIKINMIKDPHMFTKLIAGEKAM